MAAPLRLVCTLLVVAAGCCSAARWQRQPHRSLKFTTVTAPATHGEGPHWDEVNEQLYFVDIHEKYVHRYDPLTGSDHKVLLPSNVTLVIPVRDTKDKFVVAVSHSLAVMQWDGVSAEPSSLDIIDTVEQDKPGNRFNDGKADVVGRVWAGTMGPESSAGEVPLDQATLYLLDVDSRVAVPEVSPVSVSNGIAWNGDIMYYSDTLSHVIVAFDYDTDTAKISNRRVVFNITAAGIEGLMDGMTIDAEGKLWIALFNGWHVIRLDPVTGTVLRKIKLPVQRVTSASWGGPALDELYVTTSRSGLTDEQLALQPLAGCVFHITGLGVQGRAQYSAVRNV